MSHKASALCLVVAVFVSSVSAGQREGLGIIAGRVVFPDDDASSVRMDLFKITTVNGSPRVIKQCSTTTDASGFYLCVHLTPGSYILRAAPAPPAEDSANRRVKKRGDGWITTFFPGSPDLEGASILRLQAGSVVTGDVFVANGSFHTIRGLLPREATGFHASLIALSGLVEIDTGITGVVEPGSTVFTMLNVPAGRYRIDANWETQGAGVVIVHQGSAPVEISDDLPGGSVALSETTFTNITGAILPQEFRDPPRGGLMLENASGNGERTVTAIASTGGFSFGTTHAGEYYIKLADDPGFFILGMEVNGRFVDGNKLVVPIGQEEMNLNLHLGSPSGVIRGSLEPIDTQMTAAEVVARAESTGEEYTSESDERGGFTITGLAPDRYQLYAWPLHSDAFFADPKFLRRFDRDVTAVDIGGDHRVQHQNLPLLQCSP